MDSEELKKNLGIDDKGEFRIDPATGNVQKDSFWGWKDTDTRIDPGSGNVQKDSFWGWKDTDTRVDSGTGSVQKASFWGPKDTEVRINPQDGRIQTLGTFGWKDSDERIDPKTGEIQKLGFFGWKNTNKAGSPIEKSASRSNDSNSCSDTCSYSPTYRASKKREWRLLQWTLLIIGAAWFAILLGKMLAQLGPHSLNSVASSPTLPPSREQIQKPNSAPSASSSNTWEPPGTDEKRRLEASESEINQVYGAVMQSLTPVQQKALKEEERAWIKWRDIEADRVARTSAVGGSAYRVDHLNALISLTKQRTSYLRAYRPNANTSVPPPVVPTPRIDQPVEKSPPQKLADQFIEASVKYFNEKTTWGVWRKIRRVFKYRLARQNDEKWELYLDYEYFDSINRVTGKDQCLFYIKTPANRNWFVSSFRNSTREKL